jgi:hypothetical protein
MNLQHRRMTICRKCLTVVARLGNRLDSVGAEYMEHMAWRIFSALELSLHGGVRNYVTGRWQELLLCLILMWVYPSVSPRWGFPHSIGNATIYLMMFICRILDATLCEWSNSQKHPYQYHMKMHKMHLILHLISPESGVMWFAQNPRWWGIGDPSRQKPRWIWGGAQKVTFHRPMERQSEPLNILLLIFHHDGSYWAFFWGLWQPTTGIHISQ